MTDFIQITTTTGDRAVAERIATQLVDQRLAACVQISGPVLSTYRWQGQVEAAEEWVCTAKSMAVGFAKIAELIGSLHPYDVPEIIATPIHAVSHDYAMWMREQFLQN